MTAPTNGSGGEFVREERYIVIKRKHFVDDEERKLRDFIFNLNEERRLRDFYSKLASIEAVVVESDWPEYETVWRMIEARCSSTPPAQVGAATDSGEVTQADLRYQIESEIEARFWSIVDEGEGMSVPSDMWDALTRIVRAARNRDMWKSQCERQAEQLSALASMQSTDQEGLVEALEPFAAFAETFVDDEGWKHPPMRERIVDWFGPTDFRNAALTRARQMGSEGA